MLKQLLWSFLVSLTLGGIAFSQSILPEPPTGIEGNWIIEYHDADNEKGKIYVEGRSIWQVTNAQGEPALYHSLCVGPPYGMNCGTAMLEYTDPSNIELQHGSFFMGHWGAKSRSSQQGPDQIDGRWEYADYGGAMKWIRIKPALTFVKAKSLIDDMHIYGREPTRVELTYSNAFDKANTYPLNRPHFILELHGKDMWGKHTFTSPQDENLYFIPDPDIVNSYPGPYGREIIISIHVILGQDVVPGKKTIYFGTIPIEIDLIIHGHPLEPVYAISEIDLDN